MRIAQLRFPRTTLVAIILIAAFVLMATPMNALADTEGLAAGQMRDEPMAAQAVSRNVKTPDGFISIENIQSGNVSYNQKSKTLTLNNLKAESITIQKSGKATILLNGSNRAQIEDKYGKTGSAVIAGKGSLVGPIQLEGSLTIKSGKITAKGQGAFHSTGISCKDFLMLGGTLKAIGVCDMATAIECSGRFAMKAGALKAIAKRSNASDDFCKGIECQGNFSMTGGTVSAYGEASQSATGIDCGYGDFIVKGGTLKAVGKSKTGGRLTDGISCLFGDCAISKGKVTAIATGNGSAFGFSCDGKFTMTGGTFTASGKGKYGLSLGLNADYISLRKGTLKATAESANDKARGISCQYRFTVQGGSAYVSNVKSNAKPRECIAVSCGAFTTDGTRMDGDLVVKGGLLKVSGSQGTGVFCTNMNLKKGTVSVDNQSKGPGVYAYGGCLMMTGGKLSVTRSHEDAISAENYTSSDSGRSILHRGTCVIKGGKVTAKVLYPSTYYAIHVDDNFYYKKPFLKSIKGKLSQRS